MSNPLIYYLEMDFRKVRTSDMEKEQISHWLNKRNLFTKHYVEPRLQESTVEIMKFLCDALHQSDEIFITSVDILESYVHKKTFCSCEFNSLVILTCCILASSKLIGSSYEIKFSTLQKIIFKLIKQNVDRNTLKTMELDILLTVEKLPLTTVATDLCMFLEYYINRNLKLKIDIKPLCLELLNITYISRKKLFFQLKSIYAASSDALAVFQQLVCNKFYYPGGIMACALHLTKFDHFLNLGEIMKDISTLSDIHYDHIQLLSNILQKLINENNI